MSIKSIVSKTLHKLSLVVISIGIGLFSSTAHAQDVIYGATANDPYKLVPSSLYKLTVSTNSISYERLHGTEFLNPTGLAYNERANVLYYSNYNGNEIRAYDLDTDTDVSLGKIDVDFGVETESTVFTSGSASYYKGNYYYIAEHWAPGDDGYTCFSYEIGYLTMAPDGLSVVDYGTLTPTVSPDSPMADTDGFGKIASLVINTADDHMYVSSAPTGDWGAAPFDYWVIDMRDPALEVHHLADTPYIFIGMAFGESGQMWGSGWGDISQVISLIEPETGAILGQTPNPNKFCYFFDLASGSTEYEDTAPLTQGYWKNHSVYGPYSYDDTWAELPEGSDTEFLNSGMSYYEVLHTPPVKGNAYFILAHQYIGAEMNFLNGAPITEELRSVMVASKELLLAANGTVSKKQKKIAVAYSRILDEYNNGNY